MPTELVQSFRIDAAELPGEAVIFGSSAAMREVRGQIERIAHTDLPVLIRGESGTGKELIAKFLHSHSDRRDAPFVKVNCAAVPGDLLESELFGYEKGAFAGAFEAKSGLIEVASGGTLLLDEIGDMDLKLQTGCASSVPPRSTSRMPWNGVPSARICSTGSRFSTCAWRRCASARKISLSSASTFWRSFPGALKKPRRR
jgi:DNA-binding NtrC family response regulator